MMNTNFYRVPSLFCAAVVFCLAHVSVAHAGPAQARTTADDPAMFIETLASQAIATLSNKEGSLEERENKFRELLRNEFAMKKIARFVVGIHWRSMSKAERSDYLDLFAEWVLQTYSSRLGGYSGQSFKVTKTSEAGRGDIIVHSRIDQSNGAAPIRCNWRVRKRDGRFKIIDIYVEGISMAVTQRSEFAAIIKKNGVSGLIKQMQQRLEQLSAL